MRHVARVPSWWLAWNAATLERPCAPMPNLCADAMLARVAYEQACIRGDWPEAARALSALEVYRLMGVRV